MARISNLNQENFMLLYMATICALCILISLPTMNLRKEKCYEFREIHVAIDKVKSDQYM